MGGQGPLVPAAVPVRAVQEETRPLSGHRPEQGTAEHSRCTRGLLAGGAAASLNTVTGGIGARLSLPSKGPSPTLIAVKGTVLLSHQSGNPGTVWRLTARPFRPSRQLLFTAQRNKCFSLLGCALLSPTQVRTARSPQRGFWEMRLLLTLDPCEVHNMLSLLRPLGEPLATRGHWALQIWLVPLRDWIPN